MFKIQNTFIYLLSS